MYNYSTPTPGSSKAMEIGCKCPVIDNHHGKGRGDGTYWINANCPIHGDNRADGAKEDEHGN